MTDRHRVIGGRLVTVPGGACGYCHAEQQRGRRRSPAFHCDRCGRHIGRTRTVCLMDTAGPVVWCMRCRIGDGTTAWWEQHHPIAAGTQAGIRAWLTRAERSEEAGA